MWSSLVFTWSAPPSGSQWSERKKHQPATQLASMTTTMMASTAMETVMTLATWEESTWLPWRARGALDTSNLWLPTSGLQGCWGNQADCQLFRSYDTKTSLMVWMSGRQQSIVGQLVPTRAIHWTESHELPAVNQRNETKMWTKFYRKFCLNVICYKKKLFDKLRQGCLAK